MGSKEKEYTRGPYKKWQSEPEIYPVPASTKRSWDKKAEQAKKDVLPVEPDNAASDESDSDGHNVIKKRRIEIASDEDGPHSDEILGESRVGIQQDYGLQTAKSEELDGQSLSDDNEGHRPAPFLHPTHSTAGTLSSTNEIEGSEIDHGDLDIEREDDESSDESDTSVSSEEESNDNRENGGSDSDNSTDSIKSHLIEEEDDVPSNNTESHLYSVNPYLSSDDEENATGVCEANNDSQNNFEQGLLPLYDGCDISRPESELLILSIAFRHLIPDSALENLLRLVDRHMPHEEYKSKYLFLKNIPTPELIIKYYCPKCFLLLDFEASILRTECQDCRVSYSKKGLKRSLNYFIYIPLKDQLIEFFNSDVYNNSRNIINNDDDIVNGRYYKSLKEKNIIGPNDITISWNSDGVRMCSNSKLSMWPVQIEINELSYRIRKNNIMLCSLWYNKRKPPMILYLKPFVTELKDLSENGFEITRNNEIVTIKVHTIVSPVDSVARPMIQNFMQFNGRFGCSYCTHKGKWMSVGKGGARVYKYKENQEQRNVDLYREHLTKAMQTNKPYKGVKGPSIVSHIPNFNIILCFPPEYMHVCLLGVIVLFFTEWFNSSNSKCKWYLGLKIKEFDERLLAIQPPTEITRVPQPISNCGWKASERKNLGLYYSLPCLKGIMPEKYLKHWLLFVYSLYIYLKNRSTQVEKDSARKALLLFVKRIRKLYGKRFMKFNVHLLEHIPDYVEYFGSLWAWSAFPFENFNGVIAHLFHGTQYIPEQICKHYFRLKYIKNKSNIFDRKDCDPKSRDLFISLMDQCRVKNCIEYDDHLRLFGKAKKKVLVLREKTVIESFLKEKIDEKCDEYNRFIYENILYHSSNYQRLIKRSNNCILYNGCFLMEITCIVVVKMKNNLSEAVVMGKKLSILEEDLCIYKSFKSSKFSFVVKESATIVCCKPSSIDRKCIKINYTSGKYCVFPLVNTIETD